MVAVSGHVKRPGVYEIINGTTTFRDLLYNDEFCGGIREDRALKAFVPGGGSAPWFTPDQLDLPFEGTTRRGGRLDARLGRHHGDGRDHRHPRSGPHPHPLLRPRVVRQVHAVSRGRHLARAHPRTDRRRQGHRPADLDQLFEVGETICPGNFPHAANAELGLAAVPFPYKMTTICFVGPSAYAPVHSALTLFRSEFEAKITDGANGRSRIPVTVAGGGQ